MKPMKLTIPLILAALLNCAGQEAVETESSTARAPISGGTTVTANSARAFDSSGILIGYASNVTPWMITVVFSNGYISAIDFGGNHIGYTIDLYYTSGDCTGTPHLRSSGNFLGKTVFRNGNNYFLAQDVDGNGSSVSVSRNINSIFSNLTQSCTSYVSTGLTVWRLGSLSLPSVGLQTSYSAPISIQYN